MLDRQAPSDRDVVVVVVFVVVVSAAAARGGGDEVHPVAMEDDSGERRGGVRGVS